MDFVSLYEDAQVPLENMLFSIPLFSTKKVGIVKGSSLDCSSAMSSFIRKNILSVHVYGFKLYADKEFRIH